MWSTLLRRTSHRSFLRATCTTKLRKSLHRALKNSQPLSPLPLSINPSLYFYTSRAHPTPKPEYTVMDAVEMMLKQAEERRKKRQLKWERNEAQRLAKGKTDEPGGYRNQDETIELALNLNLDPRKPNQALRGSVALPHGSGKTLSCIVFTQDADVAKEALERGAVHAGGDDLVQSIVDGSIPLDDFDRALATTDMSQSLNKSLARLLGPRGLMPNTKVGTLVSSSDELLSSLSSQLSGGPVQYRTDKTGIVHLGIGKSSFGSDKLLDNVRVVMNHLYSVKPEGSIGRAGKKASKNAKYLLTAYLSSTQGTGIKLDLRTVEPTSAFFMSTPQV